MNIAGDIGDFGDWWLSETIDTIAAVSRRRQSRADYRIRVFGMAAHVGPLATGEVVELSLDDLGQNPRRLFEIGRTKHRPAVELILEAGRFLERPLSVFRLPRGRARQMAAIDVQSATPLDPADVIILFARNAQHLSGHRFFVVKRKMLEPLVKAIEGIPAELFSLALQTEHGLLEMEPDGYRQLTTHAKRSVIMRKAAVAVLAACLAGVVATFAHAEWRYAHIAQQLDAAIENLDVDVKEVRALSERRKDRIRQITSVRAQKQQAVPMVQIWEELSRVIPDNAWVSDLSINGGKVRVTGFSQSAAGLIAALDASPLFRSPTFSAPVVKAPDMYRERFTIDMELQR
jgi:general secretion pathway protein L